ncbi:MAG: biotin/lipoyl-binding protein, partial [Deltaproteobacteria bacterium]|nr:biotin/lipoyl-binding protein [Deltaproteobacteria bacterium]
MKDRVSLIVPVAAAFILSFAGCSKEGPKKPEGPAAKQAEQAITVKTARVDGRSVARTVEATGTLNPWDEVVVGNDTPGTVDRIMADLGDRVAAGQTLAVLDRREATLNHDEAEAGLQTSLKSLDREKARAL